MFVRVADKLSSGALKRLGGLKYLRKLSRGRLPVVDAVDGTVTLARDVNRVDQHIFRRKSSARSGAAGNGIGPTLAASVSQSRLRSGSTSSASGAEADRRVSVEGMLASGGYSKPVSTMKREARAARMTNLSSSEKSSRKFMLSQLREEAVEQEEE